MTEIKLNTGRAVNHFKSLYARYIFILFVSYIIAVQTAPLLWEKNIYLVHSIMELVCIFIAFSTFLITWNTCKNSLEPDHLVGFGFVAIAVFDTFHTYYWFAAKELGIGYPDLSARYWIISRLFEALLLLFFSMQKTGLRINRWLGLILVLAFSAGISLVVLFFPGIMPVMLTDNGLSRAKIILEYIVIVFTLLALYGIKDRLKADSIISYKNMFMAMLFIIPAELSFTMYDNITSIYNMYGHILKILCYYYIYRAVYASCVDYPYRKLAEAYGKLEMTNEKIKETDEILSNILDALPIGILRYEPDGRIKYMNRRLENILAYDRESLYGLSAEEFYQIFSTVEQEKSVFHLTNENSENQTNLIRTFRSMKGDNVKLSLTSQIINEGMLVYFNEVKREQEIKNFHLQTQTILNAVSNAIIMIDKNKKIINYNDALKKMLEIEEIDIIGMHIDLFNERISFDEGQLPDLVLRGKTVADPQEVIITTFKGNRRELLVYVAPIKNVENEIIGAVSVYTDITVLKKQNHSMQQQEKLAMIGQMAAGIVHEIKNPLSTIKGLSQLIKAKAGVDKIKEYANVINTAIDDASRVVNEFLSFAKPKPTVKTRTSINRIVESTQLITETQCYTKNISSRFYYSSCPMEITADENKIKQVILNLTENAITAMEGIEAPELIISTGYNAEEKEGVIQIKDNGMGMNREVLENLGKPFFTTKEKGTGLGLGICYQIMNEHEGRIEVESEKGKGTIFKVIFTHIENLI